MITKKQVLENLDHVKKYLEEIENPIEWVEINNENCPTLKKYGVEQFKIMKQKMRDSDGQVWNNISFSDAQKEAKKLGYKLPDMRQMLALLEQYRNTNKKVSCYDQEFLGIEELSYDEDVNYEWIEGAGIAFLRGGLWNDGTNAGVFALRLNYGPGYSGATALGSVVSPLCS